MEYQYSDYSFEFRFNPEDIVIQVNKDNETWQNVYLLDEIKEKNPSLNSIEKIKKLVNNCFSYKDNFNMELDFVDKNLEITFYWNNNLDTEEVKFNFYPIRKDISINQEIIDLKKQVRNLKTKCNEIDRFKGFYFNENLQFPINFKYSGSIKISPDSCKNILIDINNNFMDEGFSNLSITDMKLKDIQDNNEYKPIHKLKYLPKNLKQLSIKNCCKLDFTDVRLDKLNLLNLEFPKENDEKPAEIYQKQVEEIAKFLKNMDHEITIIFNPGDISIKYFKNTIHTYKNGDQLIPGLE